MIDEEAAAVVRRIFQMVMDGQSVNGIARTLRTARTGTLGLLMSSTRNAALASAAIQGAEALLGATGTAPEIAPREMLAHGI